MSEAHGAAGEATWNGGASPFAVGDKKLGMWLFIVSDALTFSALIVAYSYVRVANEWPKPFDFYPAIIFSSVMTLVLLSSSLTMVFGVAAGHAGNRQAAKKWIWATTGTATNIRGPRDASSARHAALQAIRASRSCYE